jgi:CheY-like chemotaxis protein
MAGDLASRAGIALDNASLYQKIHEADQRKNEFIAMLAHELRNPLAPIRNAIHLLQDGDRDPQRAAWAHDVIDRQLRQLVRLVDDLLDLSRITRGKIDLKLESIDAASVVATALETSRPLVDGLGHALTLELPSDPVRLRGDFARVAQVLANIVNNAAKYTGRGGRIALTVAREGKEVVFRVRDTGVGIPKESLVSIFEPFTQLDRTIDRSQGGLGIGLTLVRRLVEMQGGSVKAYSEGRDLGSEFVVRLPATSEPPAQEAPTPRGEATQPANGERPLSVLVVDDNVDVAESTAIVLRLTGCEVHLAHDGPGALESVLRLAPDVVLLDIGLPRMDGYQVAKQIRSYPEHRSTLLLAVSGYGQEEHLVRSRQAGFDHHLVKPIDPLALMALLRASRDPSAVVGPH